MTSAPHNLDITAILAERNSEKFLSKFAHAYASKNFTPKDFGRLIEHVVKDRLGKTPSEFALENHITSATYYRWVQGKSTKPPIHRIEQIKELVKNAPNAAKRDASNPFIAIREYIELLDRQVLCKRQWTLKTILPFRAATDSFIKQKLVDLLLKSDVPNYHCVFYAERENPADSVSKWAAMNSFGQFKSLLYQHRNDSVNKIRGWWVKDKSLAFDLGLTSLRLGLSILEYDPIKQAQANLPGLKGRSVDYLYEVALPLYPSELDPDAAIGEEIRWLEWPSSRSALDWAYREPLFNEIPEGGYSKKKVEELLETEQKLQHFTPKFYPS